MVRTLMGHVNRPVNASTGLLASGAMPLGSTARAGTGATVIDQYGNQLTAAANTPRYTYSDYVGMNFVPNPGGAGIVGGTPTGWVWGPISGVTMTSVGNGVENGVPYVDVWIRGSPSVTTAMRTILVVSTVIPAYVGQVWTHSVYMKVVRGDVRSVSPVTIETRDATNGTQGTASGSANLPINNILTRYSTTRACVDATTTNVVADIRWQATLGVDMDVVMRIGGVQMEIGSTMGPLVLPPYGQSGPVANYTGNRLLVEEIRTNYVRNPRAEGGTTGTFGSGAIAPTNWSVAAGGATLAMDYLGTNTYAGMTWARFRVYGTATSTAAGTVRFENGGGITGLAAGDSVTTTFYLRQVAGNWPANFTFWGIIQDSTPTTVLDDQTVILNANTYGFTRHQRTVTVPATGTPPYSMPSHSVLWYPTNGQTYDFTVDIAAPQVEKGPFATSLIQPPAGSPAATTRNADNNTIPLSSFTKFTTPVTNLLTYSDQFDQAAWAKGALGLGSTPVVTANAGVDPIGGSTADQVVFALNGGTTTGDRSELLQGATASVIGNTYTFSVWMMTTDASTKLVRIDFNGATGTAPLCTVTGTWTRFSTTRTATGVSEFPTIRLRGALGTDDSASVYLWGAQYEVSGTANVYIPTTTTAVTKTKLAPGTLVVLFKSPPASNNSVQGICTIDDGTSANRFGLRMSNTMAFAGVDIASGIANTALGPAVTVTGSTLYRVGMSWDSSAGTFITAIGGQTTTNSNVQLPLGVNVIHLGQGAANGFFGNVEIERVTYYPYAMTAAQLQGATA